MALLCYQRGVPCGDTICGRCDLRTLLGDGWLADPRLKDWFTADCGCLLARSVCVCLEIQQLRRNAQTCWEVWDKLKSDNVGCKCYNIVLWDCLQLYYNLTVLRAAAFSAPGYGVYLFAAHKIRIQFLWAYFQQKEPHQYIFITQVKTTVFFPLI